MSSFFGFYFPLVSAHMGWCACLPGVLLSSIAYLLLFSFMLDAVSACLGFLLSGSFLLSSVSSCFLLFPFDILGAPGDYGTHVAWQIVWGLRRTIASTLLIFAKVFPLPAKSGAFSHSAGCTSAPPSLVASSRNQTPLEVQRRGSGNQTAGHQQGSGSR